MARRETTFIYSIKLRISIDDCGHDRFTKEEIVNAIKSNQAVMSGDCLCRKKDGKVFAEILEEA